MGMNKSIHGEIRKIGVQEIYTSKLFAATVVYTLKLAYLVRAGDNYGERVCVYVAMAYWIDGSPVWRMYD